MPANEKCLDNAASVLGIPSAPMPKKTPSKLSFAPRSPSLTSAARALVAPFKTPPPKPIRKTKNWMKPRLPEKAMPSKPAKTISAQTISIHLYPKRSTIGPKIRDPARMPNGNSAVSVPMLLSSRWNRSASMLFTEPSDRNTIPNRSIPRQAAAKTRLRLYMRAELIAGQRSNGQGKQRAVANPRLETRNPKEIRKPKAEGTNPLPNPKPRTSCLPTSDPESAASQPGRRVSSDFGFRALGFSNSRSEEHTSELQ